MLDFEYLVKDKFPAPEPPLALFPPKIHNLFFTL